MPEVGLEPTHLSIPHFECGASANSATRARRYRVESGSNSVSNAIRSQHAKLLYMQIGCFKEPDAPRATKPAPDAPALRWT